MKASFISLSLLAGSSLNAGANQSDRLDRLEERVTRIEKLLVEIAGKPSPPAFQPQLVPTSSSHYQVRKGDSYWSIARQHKISVSALERANPGINPRALAIGKRIQIPGVTANQATPISSRTGTYRVKQGDILGRISEAHGIRLHQLMAANPGLNPRKLRIGAILNIPGQPTESSPTPVQRPAPIEPSVEKIPEKRTLPPSITRNRPNPYLTAIGALPSRVQKLENNVTRLRLEEPRLITVDADRRLQEIAELHQTTVARINQLNKRDLSPQQMIKEGSQLYIPRR